MKNIIIRPLVTEKATSQNENGKYVFVVDKDANKVEIKKAIEKLYSVNVASVNTIKYQGKAKTRYSKSRIMKGRKPSFKKAYVTVSEGEFIDIYGG